MLQVQNDTTIHCCVKLLEGRNRREATEFTDLFVSWQPMITTSVNDVSKSIFVKIWVKKEKKMMIIKIILEMLLLLTLTYFGIPGKG